MKIAGELRKIKYLRVEWIELLGLKREKKQSSLDKLQYNSAKEIEWDRK